MGIYKRKGSKNWYIAIGRSVDRSSGTPVRSEALALEAKWRRELWQQEKMGVTPEVTFAEAAARWAEDVGQHRKGWDRDWYRLKIIVEQLGERPASGITGREVEAATPESAQAPASKNHYLSLVRRVLRHAHERGSLATVPRLRLHRTDNSRVRYLRDWTEAERLIAAMPEHWRDPARFTLHTGLRQGTLRALRWEWISGDLLVVPGPHTKSGRTLPLPLNSQATRMLSENRSRLSGTGHIFVRSDGQPLGRMEHKTWRKVLERSGIQDFRWHDLRHTWASWMMMTGQVSLYELQQLGDWSTPAMVQRYAHLAPDYLRGVVQRASEHMRGTDPNAPKSDED